MWSWFFKKIKIFILVLVLNISDAFLKFSKGFVVEEILAYRIDNMLTTIFTVLLITGFKPIFQLFINIIVFVKRIIMFIIGCFFKKSKSKHLMKKETKQEENLRLLLQNTEEIKSSNLKLKEKIEILTQNNDEIKSSNHQLREKIEILTQNTDEIKSSNLKLKEIIATLMPNMEKKEEKK